MNASGSIRLNEKKINFNRNHQSFSLQSKQSFQHSARHQDAIALMMIALEFCSVHFDQQNTRIGQ